MFVEMDYKIQPGTPLACLILRYILVSGGSRVQDTPANLVCFLLKYHEFTFSAGNSSM